MWYYKFKVGTFHTFLAPYLALKGVAGRGGGKESASGNTSFDQTVFGWFWVG